MTTENQESTAPDVASVLAKATITLGLRVHLADGTHKDMNITVGNIKVEKEQHNDDLSP